MKNIIWDLDGTLVDSQKEILDILRLAFLDTSVDYSQIIKPLRTGPHLEIMIKEAFPQDFISDGKIQDILSFFRQRYINCGFNMTDAYEGIDDIIFDTVNFTHYIVTNKPYEITIKLLEKLGWLEKISSTKAPSIDNKHKKSKTEYFHDILIESKIDSSSFIGIGDMKTDCLAARDNNILSAGVLWGSGINEELSDCCDFLFENVKQLKDFIYNHE